MGLFQTGSFHLAAGEYREWKIECDELSPADWATLALMLVECLPEPFGDVLGVPHGGAPFATALTPYCRAECQTLLIVDDVWTTGRSMRSFIKDLRRWNDRPVDRAVVFAREPLPATLTALFRMTA